MQDILEERGETALVSCWTARENDG